jgi:ABC-type Fe3+-hydroxamate transport system substrate-binding protein
MLHSRLLAWLICGCLTSTVAGHAAEPPVRVISLAPNLTQMVLATGATDRLLAVTPFCEAPESVPRLPGGIQPESEDVLGLAPDLVLATSMTPPATRRQLARLGLRVEVIDAATLGEIGRAAQRIAQLLGSDEPSVPAAPVRELGRSAALLFGADTGYSAGRGTHAQEILEAAGLRNIAADAGGPWPQLGEEFLLAADPEVIIVAAYGPTDRAHVLRSLRAHPVRRHLTAVRSGRVVVFPAPVFSVPGPAALSAGEALRAEVEKL